MAPPAKKSCGKRGSGGGGGGGGGDGAADVLVEVGDSSPGAKDAKGRSSVLDITKMLLGGACGNQLQGVRSLIILASAQVLCLGSKHLIYFSVLSEYLNTRG
jgi:hypothetical protein